MVASVFIEHRSARDENENTNDLIWHIYQQY